MYAPHFAAALALKGRAVRHRYGRRSSELSSPICCGLLLRESALSLRRHRTSTTIGLIPSFLSQCWLRCFGSAFLRRGKSAFVAIWLAVFSHFLLDGPVY